MSHQHACHQHAYTSRIEKEVKDLRARGFVVFYKSRNEGGAVRLELRKDGAVSSVLLGAKFPFEAPVVAPVGRGGWSVVTKVAWCVDGAVCDEERLWLRGNIAGRTVLLSDVPDLVHRVDSDYDDYDVGALGQIRDKVIENAHSELPRRSELPRHAHPEELTNWLRPTWLRTRCGAK